MKHFESVSNPGGLSYCQIRTDPARMAPDPDPEQEYLIETIVDRMEERLMWHNAALIGSQVVVVVLLGMVLRFVTEGGV